MNSFDKGESQLRAALLGRSTPVAAVALGIVGAAFAAAPAATARFGLSETRNAGRGEIKPALLMPTPAASDDFAPVPPSALRLTVRLEDGDTIEGLLGRAGVMKRDATSVARLVREASGGGIPVGTEVALFLAQAQSTEFQRLERMTFAVGPAMKIVIGRDSMSRLRLAREFVAADATPKRYRGTVKDGLFWSLRSAGVPPEIAREYLEVLGTRMNILRDVQPNDTFDVVADHWRTPGGQTRSGPLLYAALERPGRRDLHLVRWSIDGRTEWLEPGKDRHHRGGFGRPVSGEVTSSFGHRVHPILRIARFHQGVDFRAAWGTPVRAAANGKIERSGWNGGYGRQVEISHGSGVTSSYAHLGRIAVAPGTHVRRGEVIGFVGSSGLSTGPHLHYEVREFGRPVNPLAARHASTAIIGPADLAALEARLGQLRAI